MRKKLEGKRLSKFVIGIIIGLLVSICSNTQAASLENSLTLYAPDGTIDIGLTRDYTSKLYRGVYEGDLSFDTHKGIVEIRGDGYIDEGVDSFYSSSLSVAYKYPVTNSFYLVTQYEMRDEGRWKETARVGIGCKF